MPDYVGAKMGITTKFSSEVKEGKKFLTIEQEGKKIYISKVHLDEMPRFAERWKVD